MVSSMIEAIRYVESHILEQEKIVTITYSKYWGEFGTSHSFTPWLKDLSEIDDGSPYVKAIYEQFVSNHDVRNSQYDLVKLFTEIAGDSILKRWISIKKNSGPKPSTRTKKFREQKQLFSELVSRKSMFNIAAGDQKLTELVLRAGIMDPQRLNEETINIIFSKIADFCGKRHD